MLRFTTARRVYTCVRCNQPIQRGTLYARHGRQPVHYHVACAPGAPTYANDSARCTVCGTSIPTGQQLCDACAQAIAEAVQ